MNGAVGLESTDFHISIYAPELGSSGVLTLTSTHRVNYDERRRRRRRRRSSRRDPAGRSRATRLRCRISRRGSAASFPPTRHVWWGPDNNGQRDGEQGRPPDQQIARLAAAARRRRPADDLVPAPLRVRDRRLGWGRDRDQHRRRRVVGRCRRRPLQRRDQRRTHNAHRHEPPGVRQPDRRLAELRTVELNLGTDLRESDGELRFRIGADESIGAPGWDIDDIVVGGLTQLPFSSLLGDTGVCTTAPPQ